MPKWASIVPRTRRNSGQTTEINAKDQAIIDEFQSRINGLEGCIAENKCDDSNNWLSSWKKDVADADAEIKSGQSGRRKADSFELKVVRKNNYEGNVISYVNMRPKGNDVVSQIKVTLQYQNNNLVVMGYQAVTQ